MQRSIVSKALIRFKVQKRRFLSSNKDGTSFIEWKAFAAGTGAGILGSLVGLGGGFVMIPFLCSPMMGLTQHMAHGTSLFAVTTTGLAGGISYGGKGEVDLYSASAIALSGIVTARLGAKFSGRLSQSSLKRALGITMIAVSPMVSLKSYLIQNDKKKNDDKPDDSISRKDFDWKTIGISSCIGLLSGFMAGLLGVGGGSIVVPGLTLLTDMSHHCALGTSLTGKLWICTLVLCSSLRFAISLTSTIPFQLWVYQLYQELIHIGNSAMWIDELHHFWLLEV